MLSQVIEIGEKSNKQRSDSRRGSVNKDKIPLQPQKNKLGENFIGNFHVIPWCLQSNQDNMAIRLFLLFIGLLCSANTINWQGTGNMTQDNMTVISDYITKNLDKSKTNMFLLSNQPTYLSDFTKSLSDYLNSRWDEAWNVFIIYMVDSTNFDSVLYGYAFRDHWMWHNGIQMDDGYYLSLIIWKDYNCKNTWKTYNHMSDAYSNSMSTSMTNSIGSIVNNNKPRVDILNDPWSAANLYVQNMQNAYPSNAFSIVISIRDMSYFFGRFCAVSYQKLLGMDKSSLGSALLLQMR